MFTGIVEEIGTVKQLNPGGITITASLALENAKIGDSVAVNGACLTITQLQPDAFAVDIVPETLRRTNLGSLTPGSPVNLERSMPANGRFGGHIVQGHIDATGTIQSITPDGDAILIAIAAPPNIARYAVEKGFIAVDGISLTIVQCDSQSFAVTLIPHTRRNTTLGAKQPGDPVNLEADIIAKYIERLAAPFRRPPIDIADEL